MRKLYYILLTMRPRQWTKNLVIFAGLIFSQNVTNDALVWKSVEAFLIFCALSGVIYIVNDIADIDKDKLHETKRNRPLPSGKLKKSDAVAAAVVDRRGGACARPFRGRELLRRGGRLLRAQHPLLAGVEEDRARRRGEHLA